jgi:hypothetical protein
VSEREKLRDLGLTYNQAVHAMQSGVALSHTRGSNDGSPKHLRVGVNSAMADAQGLAALLMDKGVFALEEYAEYMRLAANEEAAKYQDRFPGVTFR